MKRFGAISGLRARLLPMNKLRLVAPTNVLDAASRVTTALTTTALYTTDPSLLLSLGLCRPARPAFHRGWRARRESRPVASAWRPYPHRESRPGVQATVTKDGWVVLGRDEAGENWRGQCCPGRNRLRGQRFDLRFLRADLSIKKSSSFFPPLIAATNHEVLRHDLPRFHRRDHDIEAE